MKPRRRLSRSLWRLLVAAALVLLALGWSEETFRARFGVLRADLHSAVSSADSRVRALAGGAGTPATGDARGAPRALGPARARARRPLAVAAAAPLTRYLP